MGKKKCTEWKASNVINVRKYKSYPSELKFNVGNKTLNKQKEQNCDWYRNSRQPHAVMSFIQRLHFIVSLRRSSQDIFIEHEACTPREFYRVRFSLQFFLQKSHDVL